MRRYVTRTEQRAELTRHGCAANQAGTAGCDPHRLPETGGGSRRRAGQTRARRGPRRPFTGRADQRGGSAGQSDRPQPARAEMVRHHCLETLQHAGRVIADGIRIYNHRRPHQALKMNTPAETFALSA
ncbi:integrase [Burkholderia thailandensis]|nr:integrase [Burkholderia thailandensis]